MLFDKNVSRGKKILIVSLLLAAVGGFIAVYLTAGKTLLAFVSDTDRFRAWLLSFGAMGRVIFVGIRALQTVVKIIPAEPLEIGSGFAYGIWGGLLWCMMGTEIGSFFILLLSKLFGLKFMKLFVPAEKMDSFNYLKNKKNIYPILFLIYLIPGSPKDLITYFAWTMPVSTPMFLLVTGIARIPSIITSTWCGAQLGEKNYVAAAIIFGATAVCSFIGLAIYRRFEKKKKAAESVEAYIIHK